MNTQSMLIAGIILVLACAMAWRQWRRRCRHKDARCEHCESEGCLFRKEWPKEPE